MKNTGCKVIVMGQVQCVGFRFFTSREAGKLGLTGHAKNLANGNVEVLLYGDSQKIAQMVKWLQVGPETASVDEIKVTNIPYVSESGFLCF